jgi:hypothetical protein
MAELVDALGSGPSGGNTVEVRVLFWAPVINKMVRASEPFLFCGRNKQNTYYQLRQLDRAAFYTISHTQSSLCHRTCRDTRQVVVVVVVLRSDHYPSPHCNAYARLVAVVSYTTTSKQTSCRLPSRSKPHIACLLLAKHGKDKDGINFHNITIQSHIAVRAMPDHQFSLVVKWGRPIIGLCSNTLIASTSSRMRNAGFST